MKRILTLSAISVFVVLASPVFAQITIRPANDAAITYEVKRTLDSDPTLRRYDLDVATRNGVVTLGGRVFWPSEQIQAENNVQQVNGVRAIRDHIAIAGLNDMTNP